MSERQDLLETLMAYKAKSTRDKPTMSYETSRALNALICALEDEEAEAIRSESLE